MCDIVVYAHVVQIIFVKGSGALNKMEWTYYCKRKKFNCVKHLKDHFEYEFRWFILSRTSKHYLKRKILEAHYIKTYHLSLSNQIKSVVLNVFTNGVTQSCSFYPSFIYFNWFFLMSKIILSKSIYFYNLNYFNLTMRTIHEKLLF